MSAIVQTEIYCDECGRSEYFRTANKADARRDARKMGWATNIKPTPERHAELDVRRDECPHCRRRKPAARNRA